MECSYWWVVIYFHLFRSSCVSSHELLCLFTQILHPFCKILLRPFLVSCSCLSQSLSLSLGRGRSHPVYQQGEKQVQAQTWGLMSQPALHLQATSHLLISSWCCSVAQLCPTLWPHGLQNTRLPCPSPSPGVSSNWCPLSQKFLFLPSKSIQIYLFSSLQSTLQATVGGAFKPEEWHFSASTTSVPGNPLQEQPGPHAGAPFWAVPFTGLASFWSQLATVSFSRLLRAPSASTPGRPLGRLTWQCPACLVRDALPGHVC